MANVEALEQLLLSSIEDGQLTKTEKLDIVDVLKICSEDQRRFMQNKAFDLFREAYVLNSIPEKSELLQGVRWLEKMLRVLQPPQSVECANYACFSPGGACRKAIIGECRRAQASIDICVFTISDNLLADAILAAKQRGVHVRIITDNDKMSDLGSDIEYLRQSGVEVKQDVSDYHMHHKFAIFDNKILLNGSFNWTRSASEFNQENIMMVNDQELVATYSRQFEALWQRYS